jgi:hypothetical protein
VQRDGDVLHVRGAGMIALLHAVAAVLEPAVSQVFAAAAWRLSVRDLLSG